MLGSCQSVHSPFVRNVVDPPNGFGFARVATQYLGPSVRPRDVDLPAAIARDRTKAWFCVHRCTLKAKDRALDWALVVKSDLADCFEIYQLARR